MENLLKKIIRYGLYPVLFAGIVAIITLAIHNHWNYGKTYGLTTLGLVLTLLTIEQFFPFSKDWGITSKSFLRDLKYIAVCAPTIAVTKSAFGWAAIFYSEHHQGLFTNSPLLLSVVGFLLVFEFFQYWSHRYYHEGRGPVGRFFWKMHLAHHLPNKVYVVMHAVFNPLNAFLTTAIIQTPLILLGISPEAALAANLMIDLQSLISHFNVDLKTGFLNYIFIGTETHRYHHSADVEEAKNYGNTLAIWDLVFGTFHYHPGIAPQELGLEDSGKYPPSTRLFQVVSLPFRPESLS